jgi:hypothetical protein
MHPAAKVQFESIAAEYASWRAIAEDERSPAPAWWWGPAMDALDEAEPMTPELCASLELPGGSCYGAAAGVLMAALAGQTSLPWPDEFPKKRPDASAAGGMAAG